MSALVEANFDGLVGPTHHFAGLSRGNEASQRHAGQLSEPRTAALQGLAKMRQLMTLGVPQGVLLPPRRPRFDLLLRLGYAGDASLSQAPATWLSAAYSASSMWRANAATVTPSAESGDGRVHLSVANLVSTLHRSLEAEETLLELERVFGDAQHFAVHAALPATTQLGDEGAANHTRLVGREGAVHVFVHGDGAGGSPQRYPVRQRQAASRAVAARHGLRAPVVLQQSPAAIDAGVFHNDVIAVGHRDTWLMHAQAYVEPPAPLPGVRVAPVEASDLSLEEAVQSYLFNSQLVSVAGSDRPHLVAPQDVAAHPAAAAVVRRWIDEGVLAVVHFVPLRESMQNGGGPACLRLCVPLSETERAAVAPEVWLTPERADAYEALVRERYRDRLSLDALRDPAFAAEAVAVTDALHALRDSWRTP